MAEIGKRRSGFALLGIAAVAGVVAGTIAVYVRASGDSNGAGCVGAAAVAARVSPLAVGEVAAFEVADRPESYRDLSFLAPDGRPVTLADFAGRTVLLNLWATWCVPCRAEMPALDLLEAKLGGDDFAVIAVNVDVNNEERARNFLEEIEAANLEFYSDPSLGVFNNLKRRGHAFGLPTTVLVDGDGCGIGNVAGPAEWDSEEARALVLAALARS
jgi:thiol-disulfide isomerase/thioredoxin